MAYVHINMAYLYAQMHEEHDLPHMPHNFVVVADCDLNEMEEPEEPVPAFWMETLSIRNTKLEQSIYPTGFAHIYHLIKELQA